MAAAPVSFPSRKRHRVSDEVTEATFAEDLAEMRAGPIRKGDKTDEDMAMGEYIGRRLRDADVHMLPTALQQLDLVLAKRPDVASWDIVTAWLRRVFSDPVAAVIMINRHHALNALDASAASSGLAYIVEETIAQATTVTNEHVHLAQYIDQTTLHFLQHFYQLDPIGFVSNGLPLVRTRLMTHRGGQYLFATKQWLATIALATNTARLRRISRGYVQQCRSMETDEKLCRNNEGNLGGDRWCDVPPWAYYKHNGNCYDIRELLQSVHYQVEETIAKAAALPSFPLDRSPITPLLLNQLFAKAVENGFKVPRNVPRIQLVYRALGQQQPVNALALWDYYQRVGWPISGARTWPISGAHT